MDFRNNSTTNQICTNLWYVVLDSPSVTLDGKTEAHGMYTGVQWDLQITSTGAKSSKHTAQWPNA